jgi:endonuclease/exonuclease/phosphatase family metal-dependent hydrolase
MRLRFLFLLAWSTLLPPPGASQEPTASRFDTLRILAYNTHHGEGMDGVLDLERIAALIRSVDPHVVALQEIDRVVRRTGDVDQATVYGELTGMEPLFGDFMEYQGGHYGMALLTRLPVVEWVNHRLPPGAEPRSAVTARIRFEESGREVVVSGIHFYRTEEERMAQARRLVGLLGVEESEPGATTPPAPVILAGDFNSLPGSPVMQFLASRFGAPEKEGSGFTFPADDPAREIDYFLIHSSGEFRVLEYRVVDEAVASDHRPIFMAVEFR